MKKNRSSIMVELIRTIRKHATNRRHIEIPIEYYDDLQVGDRVVILDKETYNELKNKKK